MVHAVPSTTSTITYEKDKNMDYTGASRGFGLEIAKPSSPAAMSRHMRSRPEELAAKLDHHSNCTPS
jgi:hypothetical protein